ncbi:TPA: hypothetical protein ACXH6M_002099, partial [Neisseria meningitidis]
MTDHQLQPFENVELGEKQDQLQVKYSGLTKTSTALPRFSSKRTILSGAEAPSESVPYYLYCLRLR